MSDLEKLDKKVSVSMSDISDMGQAHTYEKKKWISPQLLNIAVSETAGKNLDAFERTSYGPTS